MKKRVYVGELVRSGTLHHGGDTENDDANPQELLAGSHGVFPLGIAPKFLRENPNLHLLYTQQLQAPPPSLLQPAVKVQDRAVMELERSILKGRR